jgi:DNA-binding transcriptional regulator YdaS (Cro superfamily)
VQLRDYLDSLPPGGVVQFAASLDMSRVYLSQLAAKLDGREPSPHLAVKIWRLSGGKVTRQELRADWPELWPELDRRKAPRTTSDRRKATPAPTRKAPAARGHRAAR